MSDMFECYNIRIMAAYVRGMLSRNGQLLNVPLDRLREDECEVRLEAGRAAGLKMIFITGDTHSSFNRFTRKNFPEQDDMTKEDYVIIAGDFGGIWYPVRDASHRKEEDYNLDELDKRPFTTLFIPGNHENYARLMSDEFRTVSWKGGVAKQIRPSILMLMRGEMYDIEGIRVFTFGGARSHDIQDGLLDVEDPDAHRCTLWKSPWERKPGKPT